MLSTLLPCCKALTVLLLTLALQTVTGDCANFLKIMLDVQRILSILAANANTLFVAGNSVLVTKAVLLPAMGFRTPANQHFCLHNFGFFDR